MYLLNVFLIFLIASSTTDANYIWKDTDWVYLEKGAAETKTPERSEGSGDKYDSHSGGDRSYGSVKTYTDDTEDEEGSGYREEEYPPHDVDQEVEEEEEGPSYFESSGGSQPGPEDDYETIERSKNINTNHANNNAPPPPPVTEDSFFEDSRDDISFETPYSTQSTPKREGGVPSVTGKKTKNKSASFFAQPGIMAAVVGGAVVGLLCAILFVMFIVYRMRKKDEGSYALDEPKRSPTVNSYSKPLNREIYA